MKLHVLAGDSLAGIFKKTGIEGDAVICRECLIDGNLGGELLWDFWKTRASYISSAYDAPAEDYYRKVVGEFLKLVRGDADEIYLWFEYDLFCQVNMWFILSLLAKVPLKNVFRVAPIIRESIWTGFGDLDAEQLRVCFEKRQRFTFDEVQLGVGLWHAYKNGDLNHLEKLSAQNSKCFPYLKEACSAEIDRKKNNRPQNALKNILNRGKKDFQEIFKEFSASEGVYGFGDLQVKLMLNQIKL